MKRTRILFMFVSVLLFNLSGCINYSTVMPSNHELWGGYNQGQIYVLLKDVTLVRVGPITGLEGRRLMFFQASLEDMTKIAAKHPLPSIDPWEVIGTVQKGTKVKATRLVRNRGFSYFFGTHDELTIYAVILDGPYTGSEVDLGDTSSVWCPKEKPNDTCHLSPSWHFLRPSD